LLRKINEVILQLNVKGNKLIKDFTDGIFNNLLSLTSTYHTTMRGYVHNSNIQDLSVPRSLV